MLKVEHKKLKLGRFTMVDVQRLVKKGIVLKALPARNPKIGVIDAYLKPLAGAKVYMKTMYGLTGVESLVGLTNSKGGLTVPAVYHGGCYSFRAVLAGYCPMSAAGAPVGSKNWIDSIEIVTEPATKVVKGKVVDTNGKPVPGAKVTTDFGPSAVTGKNGEFTLKQMPSWPLRLEARKGSLRGTNLDAKGNLRKTPETVITVRSDQSQEA